MIIIPNYHTLGYQEFLHPMGPRKLWATPTNGKELPWCTTFENVGPILHPAIVKRDNPRHAAESVLYRDIVPTGGTSGHFGRNRDCPAEIGTLDMSVILYL